MPSYTYLAREAGSGREIRSNIDAGSEQAAIAALLNRNLLVVSIQEKIGRKGRTSGGKVALVDLVVFTRQLATMIDEITSSDYDDLESPFAGITDEDIDSLFS